MTSLKAGLRGWRALAMAAALAGTALLAAVVPAPVEAGSPVDPPARTDVRATFPISSCAAQCPCVPPEDLVAARDAAEFVFRGRLESVFVYMRDGTRVADAAVVVSEVFKRPHEAWVEVDTPAEAAECGASFGLWSGQLIFARRHTTADGSLIWVTDVRMGHAAVRGGRGRGARGGMGAPMS